MANPARETADVGAWRRPRERRQTPRVDARARWGLVTVSTASDVPTVARRAANAPSLERRRALESARGVDVATGARVGDVRDVHHRHDVVNPVPRRRPRGRGADAAHGNSRFGLGAERRVLLASAPGVDSGNDRVRVFSLAQREVFRAHVT